MAFLLLPLVPNWAAIGTSDGQGLSFAKGAGAAFFSTVSLQVNGVLVGTISNPAQIGGVLSLTEITRDYAKTVGSTELLQADSLVRRTNTFATMSPRPPPRLPRLPRLPRHHG